jgi:transposase
MKAGPDRRYTPEFRDAAVKQVIEGGRAVAAVARSLEMSNKSLANWVYRRTMAACFLEAFVPVKKPGPGEAADPTVVAPRVTPFRKLI